MTIDKTGLLAAVKKVLPGVEKGKSLLEGADSVVFTASGVHSYNDAISVTAPYESGELAGGAYKSADMFKLLGKMPGAMLDVEKTEKGLSIRSEKVTAKLNHLTSGEKILQYLGTLNLDGLDWKPLAENFWKGVGLCKINCSNSYYRGLWVYGKEMLSTDELRLNFFDLSEEMTPFWIDDPSVTELLKLPEAPTEYAVKDDWVHFRSPSSGIFSTKRKDHTAYPANAMRGHRDAVLAQPDQFRCEIPADLIAAVDRVSVLAEDVAGFQAIRARVYEDRLVLTSARDSGSVEETLPVKAEIAAEGLEGYKTFQADAGFLTEAARKVKTLSLKIGDVPACVFSGEGFLLLMATINES